MTTLATTPQSPRKLPPVLGRLLSGTFWLALRTPLQVVFALWTIPLILNAIGPTMMGAFWFAWGFGFFQMLFEFGMSSALQRQVAESWAKGDREGVDRAIACGMNFYAAMTLVQVAALLALAYGALPYSEWSLDSAAQRMVVKLFRNQALAASLFATGMDVPGVEFATDLASYALIIKLFWLQALTAPFYGLSTVVSSVLQAARRYDFLPRLELAVVTLRFLLLWAGVRAGVDFFSIVVAQTLSQIGLIIIPAIWVMVRELGHAPHFRGAGLSDYRALVHISFYMFLIQLSVVLADRVDTAILGFALTDPGPASAAYQVVSKPFMLIRQSGWTLAYMVMPAVASLLAARDERALDRVKYDGTRLHIGALLPVALLAGIHAAPFLTLWVGDKLGYDAAAVAPLLRLFLIATIPLVLSVPVQVAFGMNKPEVIALAALAGSLVNLPLSYYLTLKLNSMSGVIWGTVLTTLFSNLLVPGMYVFRALDIRPRAVLVRTLSAPAAGAVALVLVSLALRAFYPLHPDPKGGPALLRWLPLVSHLTVGSLAYVAGYLAVPAGRADFMEITGKLRLRAG
ncbi:MAG: hypothetical protein NVSMB9_06080 [Isosphaeraceae bacterium]